MYFEEIQEIELEAEEAIPESQVTPEDNVTPSNTTIEEPVRVFKEGDRVQYNGAGRLYGAPSFANTGTIVREYAPGYQTVYKATAYVVELDNDMSAAGSWVIHESDLTLIESETPPRVTLTLNLDTAKAREELRQLIDAAEKFEKGARALDIIWEGDEAPKKATFNRAVDEAFAKSQAISNQRGGEYLDSWATENQSTHFLDSVLRMIDSNPNEDGDNFFLSDISSEAKRLVMLASLCDVKVSRMGGPYKDDTFEDLLNYLAALTTLQKEYVAANA